LLRDELTEAVARALTGLGVEPPADVRLERPGRREHGDWSTNAALASAGAAGVNPRELASRLADALNADPPRHVERVEVAGPGFVNFHLAETWLHDVLVEVVEGGTTVYAAPDIGHGRSVNVEFVSANPNKPVHVGHGRNACVGDAIARLLERTNHRVTRENYLNDRGLQMTLFAQSLAARKRGEEPPEDGYRGAYINEWAAEMPEDADPLEWGYARALRSHRDTMAALGIDFDVWFSERSMVADGSIERALEDLRAGGFTYEADGATWFAASRFGDEKDRVLVRRDGEYTYLMPDIAYHRDKFARGHDLLIDVWGADHHGYVAREKAGVAALGHDPDDLEVIVQQLVDLVQRGEEVRMSGRAGDFVELDWLLDQVGADAARFTYLLQSTDTRLTFDLDLVASQAMENPVYYVQYAHARICSIGKQAAERGVERGPLESTDLSLLTHQREVELLRALERLPEIVEAAARERAPHKITTWLRDTAGAFHGFYHDCYVMGEGIPPELTQARLWLVEATRIALLIGLDLIGVSAPESM
jgi:arginyl-tRNA synthetase